MERHSPFAGDGLRQEYVRVPEGVERRTSPAVRTSGPDPQADYVVQALYSARYRTISTHTANGTYPNQGAVTTHGPPVTRE